MNAASKELVGQSPKTGPWIIGYAVSLGLAFTLNTLGITGSFRSAAPFWIPIAICTAMIIYTSWQRHRLLGTVSSAVRAFWRRMMVSAAFMFASYCLLAFAQAPGGWSATAIRTLTILPHLGFIGMVYAVHAHAFEERDEYLRSLSQRQIIIASGATLLAAIIWSGLAAAQIVPSVSLALVVLIWFAGLGLGRMVNEARP